MLFAHQGGGRLPWWLAALLVTGCSSEPGPPTIRVGLVCGGVSLAALAIDSGGLPDGLQAQKVCFDSGSDAVQALVGGSIDAFVGAGEHVDRQPRQGSRRQGLRGGEREPRPTPW